MASPRRLSEWNCQTTRLSGGDFRHAAAVAEEDIAVGQLPGIMHQPVGLVLPDDFSARCDDHHARIGGNQDLPLGRAGKPIV